jgi:hypothetical protein
MRRSTPPPPKWRRLLELGQELITQPEIGKQRELILAAATDLVGGEAKLWLSEWLGELPEASLSPDAAAPPSPLMCQALEREQPVTEETSIALLLRGPSHVLGILEVKTDEASPLSNDDIALLE